MSLSSDITADLADFLDPTEFGKSAVFNGTTTINVIFDNESTPILDVETGGIMIAGPQAIARTTDVPSAKGKTLLIDSTTYKIIEARPDGTGLTTLKLSKD